jgi:hypothetical protein
VHYKTVLLLVGDQMGERNHLGKCLEVMIHTKANITSFKIVTPEEQHEDEILQNPKIHLSMITCHLPSTASEAAEPTLQKRHKAYLSPLMLVIHHRTFIAGSPNLYLHSRFNPTLPHQLIQPSTKVLQDHQDIKNQYKRTTSIESLLIFISFLLD